MSEDRHWMHFLLESQGLERGHNSVLDIQSCPLCWSRFPVPQLVIRDWWRRNSLSAIGALSPSKASTVSHWWAKRELKEKIYAGLNTCHRTQLRRCTHVLNSGISSTTVSPVIKPLHPNKFSTISLWLRKNIFSWSKTVRLNGFKYIYISNIHLIQFH